MKSPHHKLSNRLDPFGLVKRGASYVKNFMYFQQEDSDFSRDLQLMSSKRNPAALAIAGAMLLLITTFLVIVGWQREYIEGYLSTKIDIKSFDNNSQEWRVTSLPKKNCGAWDDCLAKLRSSTKKTFTFEELTKPWRDFDHGLSDSDRVYISVETTIEKSAWKEFFDLGYSRYMIGIPSAEYFHARAFINGEPVGQFLKSNRIGIPVYLENEPDQLNVEIIFLRNWSYSRLFIADDEPLLLTTPGEYNSWVRMLVMRSASRGSWVSDLAFIVLAVFFLLLFLFVDSSPEIAGLALFVSLDAFSRSLGYGWIPLPYLDQVSDMADSASQVMRLYFLLQLGRVGSSKIGSWLVLSLVYSLFVTAGSWSNAFGWKILQDRVYELNAWFALFVAFVGMGISIPTAIKIKNRKLPWRQWALIIATIACSLQVVAYLNHVIPEIGDYPIFFKVRTIILPLSVYLLASSAFVNISTLENRVRVLSSAKSKSDLIEKELELGRLVQNAYMKLPDLPNSIDMSCHFEAAFYVSGDAYFVHWEPDTKRLVVILGDMTGHGVHAALKATTLQVIARTIFRDPMRRSSQLGERFVVYEQALRSFFRESWGDGDLPTFLGVEMDLLSHQVRAHRANFPFPMIVVKTDSGRWDVRVWADHNEAIDVESYGRQVFLVSATDGIVGGSKNFHRIAKNLKSQLHTLSHVDSDVIKKALLELVNEAESQIDDDKTMIVFGLKNPKDAA